MILRRDALKKFQSFCQFIESRYSGSWRQEKQSYAKTKRFFNFIFAAAAAILYVSCLIFFIRFVFIVFMFLDLFSSHNQKIFIVQRTCLKAENKF